MEGSIQTLVRAGDFAMLDAFWETCRIYSAFYTRFLSQQWAHMTPIKYAAVLIFIGAFGWFLMRNSVKKC